MSPLAYRGYRVTWEKSALSYCLKWVSLTCLYIISATDDKGWVCVSSVSLNFPWCPRNLFTIELNQMLHKIWSNSKLFCSVNADSVPSWLCEGWASSLLSLSSFSILLICEVGMVTVPSSRGWWQDSLRQRTENSVCSVAGTWCVQTLSPPPLHPTFPSPTHDKYWAYSGRWQSLMLNWIGGCFCVNSLPGKRILLSIWLVSEMRHLFYPECTGLLSALLRLKR